METIGKSRVRLGYACLNTELRAQKSTIFCSRTCRLETLRGKGEEGLTYLQSLGLQNVADLRKLIEWNVAHSIYFMRISSDLFPFASHGEHGYKLDFAAAELKSVGDYANSVGHRLTMHPGQYNQLGSLNEKVVENTIRDLEHHGEILDRMGMGKDSVLVIHMGGANKDKKATVDRWEQNFAKLSKSVRDRIVLENDEISFNVQEILPTCKRLDIPLVFDWHHHDLNPGNGVSKLENRKNLPTQSLLEEISETWKKRDIRQKMHYSESQEGAVTLMQRRAHSADIKAFPPCLHMDVDLMIEAKNKERSWTGILPHSTMLSS
jgi:UV DNA damage endonuclease